MQIQSDYNSFSSTGYNQKHNHHITKCLHEEQSEQNKFGASGRKKDMVSADKSQEGFKQEIVYTHEEVQKSSGGVKKGMGFIKGIWDSMGDEKTEEHKKISLSDSRYVGIRGIDAVSSAIKQIFPNRIVNKWESIREKIKVSISNTLKRFGKENEAFNALTDPKGRFTGKRETDRHLKESKEKSGREKEGEIPAALLSDSHLMDSYSKTGAYCRLNENLTYQKKSASGKPS